MKNYKKGINVSNVKAGEFVKQAKDKINACEGCKDKKETKKCIVDAINKL